MPNYDFRTLSPTDFELLTRDLLEAEYGWHLEAFGHGPDGGVDLRGQEGGRKIVVQCKHYANSTFTDLQSAARKEVTKMNKECPDQYFFVTSQDLSRGQKDALASDLSPWLTHPRDILTQRDINKLLGKHSRVERQHFKLWLASTDILDLIIRNGIWERSEALMEDIRDRVRLYVRTPGYERATARLDTGHVVVLTGTPGVGKSMLAEMLLLSHWYDGWQVVSVSSNIDEAWDTYQRHEKQIFFYDDFLGQTDISERVSKNEDARIVRLMDRVALDASKRLVMTSRSQILRQANLAREPIARGNFHLRECIVELSDYGMIERARILYNHLYFSHLPRQIIRDYVAGQHYWRTVEHPNFSPRIVEQVLKQNFATAETLTERLATTLDRPIELWGTMFANGLSPLAQNIVLTLVTFPVKGVPADTLRRIARRGASPIEFTHALRALEDTFISVDATSPRGAAPKISYANPSVRDFILATLDNEPEYVRQLISEISTVEQMQTLLGSAASKIESRYKVRSGYKFPRIAQIITANQQLIVARIDAVVASQIQIVATQNRSTYQLAMSIVRPLAILLDYAQHLMPETINHLLAQALTLVDQHNKVTNWMDARAFECLTRALIGINQAPGQIEGERERIFDLIEGWSDALAGLDDITDFVDFFASEVGDKLNRFFHMEDLITQYVEDALRQEIDNISNNRTDEQADNQWLDDIEHIARDFGIESSLAQAIQSESDSIAEHYADVEKYSDDSSTTGRPSTSAPKMRSSWEERSFVNGIFRELS